MAPRRWGLPRPVASPAAWLPRVAAELCGCAPSAPHHPSRPSQLKQGVQNKWCRLPWFYEVVFFLSETIELGTLGRLLFVQVGGMSFLGGGFVGCFVLGVFFSWSMEAVGLKI